MQICVRLFATFREGRFKEAHLDYPPGTDCRGVVIALGLTEGMVGILMVNNRHAAFGEVLQDGDTLALFPPIGGG